MGSSVDAGTGGIDLASEPPFRVGEASVDPASREASYAGATERLAPQNIKVLVALARNKGEVVTRDRLVALCWDGRFIGDDVINRSISTLRQFAGRAGGFEIETVPRSGYRLIVNSSRRAYLRPLWIGCAAALVLLAGTIGLWVSHSRGAQAGQPPTIAILPFTTASNDPRARELASAAHDSVARTLSQTWFTVSDAGPGAQSGATAADFELTADADTTSAVQSVTVRMEETAHHVIVYSHRFEARPEDPSGFADRVGAQVAGSIGWTGPLLMVARRDQLDSQTLGHLLQSINITPLDPGPINSLSAYQEARDLAAKNPSSALAQLNLARDAFPALFDVPLEQRQEIVATGREAADRAVALAPDFGETYVPWCLLHNMSARRTECEDRLRAGMKADPRSPWADYYLADRIKDGGRFIEALDLSQRSLARDQYVMAKIALVLRMLEAVDDSSGAEALYRRTQGWWPDSSTILWDRIYGMADRGDFAAIARFAEEAGGSLGPVARDQVRGLPQILAARNVAAARTACPVTMPGSPRRDFCMILYAELGDNDDAFAIAGQQLEDRVGSTPADEERIFLNDPWFSDTDIVTGPGAAGMRRDPRYFDLVRRTGLLAYWRSSRLPDFCRPPRPEPICSILAAKRS